MNTVKDVPTGFKDWVRDNSERMDKAEKKGSLPYFLKDNMKTVEKIQSENSSKVVTPVLSREQTIANELTGNLSDSEKNAIANNCVDIEKQLGITKGAPMTIDDADMQKANPNHGAGREYSTNCQTCVPAYMLRLRGFDVTAKGNTKGSLSEWISKGHSFDIWKNADGSKAQPSLYRDWLNKNGYKKMSESRFKKFFDENCKDEGVYVVTIAWKGSGAHATIIQRMADGSLTYIEPQLYDAKFGVSRSIDYLCKNGSPDQYGRGVMRIDNKIFDTKYLSIFDK